NDVDLVLLAVGRDTGGLASHPDGLCGLEAAQVNNGNGVALSVGDVSVFAVSGAVVGQRALVEVPPTSAANQRQQNCQEKRFFQGRGLAVRVGSRASMEANSLAPGGTVRAKTAAICRTSLINSSNCSGYSDWVPSESASS